jgi:glycosyltransferase involved in cell wall biosynthesis
MKSGFERALVLGADVVVKVDADGQMDPALLPQFLAPIERGDADIAKGNRFDDLSVISRMPPGRRLGNLALSFLVKLASGYWRTFDPCNGYVAIRSDVLRRMDMTRLDDRFFFEISLLCEAYTLRARVRDVPMAPVYANETSSLSPIGVIPNFSMRLIQRAARRIFISYFMRDFNVVSLFLLTGVPALIFGVAWSISHWIQSARTQVFASTGTVMIGVLSIVLGFQLVLQAIVLDVENEPGRTR